MDTLPSILSTIINVYIGKKIGVIYTSKIVYLDSITCCYKLSPNDSINKLKAAEVIETIKGNKSKTNNLCLVLNKAISNALDKCGTVKLAPFNVSIRVDRRFDIWCEFSIEHIGRDTDILFMIEF